MVAELAAFVVLNICVMVTISILNSVFRGYPADFRAEILQVQIDRALISSLFSFGIEKLLKAEHWLAIGVSAFGVGLVYFRVNLMISTSRLGPAARYEPELLLFGFVFASGVTLARLGAIQIVNMLYPTTQPTI
jgi:hypothetical protein